MVNGLRTASVPSKKEKHKQPQQKTAKFFVLAAVVSRALFCRLYCVGSLWKTRPLYLYRFRTCRTSAWKNLYPSI